MPNWGRNFVIALAGLLVLAPAAFGAAQADGRLADIAPTALSMLGLAQPAAMTGCCLLQPIPASTRKA